jgi:hypothetical protein
MVVCKPYEQSSIKEACIHHFTRRFPESPQSGTASAGSGVIQTLHRERSVAIITFDSTTQSGTKRRSLGQTPQQPAGRVDPRAALQTGIIIHCVLQMARVLFRKIRNLSI